MVLGTSLFICQGTVPCLDQEKVRRPFWSSG